MHSASDYKKPAGITLLELLVTIAVSGILATISVAGFSTLLAHARMTSAVNDLVHNLHLARQQARVFGTDVALCKSANRRQCDEHLDWHAGWLMFVNHDQDNPPHADAGEPILVSGHAADWLEITANRRAFVMRPFGKRSTNGTFILCDPLGKAGTRSVVVSYTGKPRIGPAANSASGDCASYL